MGRIPEGLSKSIFDGLGCQGYARLILSELGGSEKARILWVEELNEESPDDSTGHAYVIPEGAPDNGLAYNNSVFDHDVTIGEVKELGKDITEEVLSSPWEGL